MDNLTDLQVIALALIELTDVGAITNATRNRLVTMVGGQEPTNDLLFGYLMPGVSTSNG